MTIDRTETIFTVRWLAVHRKKTLLRLYDGGKTGLTKLFSLGYLRDKKRRQSRKGIANLDIGKREEIKRTIRDEEESGF